MQHTNIYSQYIILQVEECTEIEGSKKISEKFEEKAINSNTEY